MKNKFQNLDVYLFIYLRKNVEFEQIIKKLDNKNKLESSTEEY